MQDTTSFPLKGITILDLSRVLAGPYCTMILAQLGARVIKVEIPGTGDDSRAFGPFANGKSLYFASINYDKQSIALNLKEPADRETFEGLVGIGEGALVLSTVKEQLRLLGQAAPLTPETFERVQELRRRVYQSNDYLEGIRAFHEKRKPVFNAT